MYDIIRQAQNHEQSLREQAQHAQLVSQLPKERSSLIHSARKQIRKRLQLTVKETLD